MTFPPFLKRKSTYIIIAIVVAVVAYFMWSSANSAKVVYETNDVVRGNLIRTAEVTGEIKPSARLKLAFGKGGTLRTVKVKVGTSVKAGDVLAELNDKDVKFSYESARANLSAAQAQLNLILAGQKSQVIQMSEAGVEQAQANVSQAETALSNIKLTTDNNIKTSELAVKNAEEALANQQNLSDQSNTDAYDDAQVALLSALGPLQTTLTDGDRIIGVDNKSTNAAYLFQLGVTNRGSMDNAKTSYAEVKPVKEEAERLVRALTSSSTKEEIEAAGFKLQRALTLAQVYCNDVINVLNGSIPGSNLSDADLTVLKNTISSDRINLSSQSSGVQNAMQLISTSKLSKTQTIDQLTNQLETAKLNLETMKTNAQTSVKSSEASLAVAKAGLSSAKADLDMKKAPPRGVDLDPLRATVANAQASFEKAQADLRDIQIIAPIDGMVSEIIPSVGEQVNPNQAAIGMLSADVFDIEALIPESDVTQVKVGQHATTTLDAFGDEVEFSGNVLMIEPDQTLIQDAVYYKCRVSIEAGDKIVRPGMTANSIVLVGEANDVIIIPSRSIRTDAKTGEKIVKILKSNGSTEDQTVQLGLKGDEGKIAVLSGLKEGEKVVVSETKK